MIPYFPYLISLLSIGFLVFIHELGHFLFCKLFNIPVSKFNIGFGPQLFIKKFHNTEYGISIIPLGGFIEIANNENEVLTKTPILKTSIVLLGGILFNLLFSYLVIIGLVTQNPSITQNEQLKLFYPQPYIIIADKEGTEIKLKYNCKLELLSQLKPIEFTLKDIDNQEIIFENSKFFRENFIINIQYIKSTSVLDSLQTSIKLVNNIIINTAGSILRLFKECQTKTLSGVLGIIQKIKDTLQTKKLSDFFILLAHISISLALFNLLPLPILDGGKLLLIIISKIIHRSIPEKIENFLTYLSLAVIILLTITSTFYDITRIFHF